MDTIQEVKEHYNEWTEDSETRLNRKNGWNAVTDAYWGKLPSDWPYTARVVDPRIRTSLNEKNGRLLNAKLQGRLVPREGGDVLKARINNSILDFQWDNAMNGGTMLGKWSDMDMDTRLYASKFARVVWKVIKEGKKVMFEGNEFEPLDIRDCGMDASCHNIRDAKWFQAREWAKVEDLEEDRKLYPGLRKLITAIRTEDDTRNDRRDTAYTSRLLSLKGLTDRVGEDKTFPVVEICHEYRIDKWITFSPQHDIILREIDNPNKHGKIPIVQLKYYPLNDDPLGESEVEPTLPLWRAIQATLCGYLDNMNTHIRPPLKIVSGACRIETIVHGPEAQWMVDRMDAVEEMKGSGEALRYFQTTYSALVSAFNTAMGDLSQGVSQIDQFNPEKTATEIKQTAKQQNIRDQSNQNKLAECIEDMMSMWMSNNKQFLFSDPAKKEIVLKILGTEAFEYFKRSGMDEMELEPEAMELIGETIQMQGGNVSDDDILAMMEAGKMPKYPVVTKDGVKPKMKMSELEDSADLVVTPDDMEGIYDYVSDVKSMAAGASEEMRLGQQEAFEILMNPQVTSMLQLEGYKPKIKELLVSILENNGSKDSERYFEQIDTQGIPGQGAGPVAGNPQAGQQPGLQQGAAPVPQAAGGQGMARPQQVR